jgi:PAS domain S-box-containing protein
MTTSNPEMSIDYQQVVAALGDAVVICNRDGVIRFWNAAAERLFGFTKTEALGKSLDLIIPERLRASHWAGFKKAMASGNTRYNGEMLRVPAVQKNGRPLSIAFSVALLFGTDRRVTGITAVIRDDTEVFAQQRVLRRIFAEEDELRNALAEQ